MPGFDIVLAELSEDPISVDRATAAVQGDEAGAVEVGDPAPAPWKWSKQSNNLLQNVLTRNRRIGER